MKFGFGYGRFLGVWILRSLIDPPTETVFLGFQYRSSFNPCVGISAGTEHISDVIG